MFKLLLDSSNTKLAVGIAKDNHLIDSVFYDAWQQQSEKMVPEIIKLMNKHNIQKNDIDGVVVGVGPGSYTGVRIAVTIAKVIGVILNVKIYPVSSLGILKSGKDKSICLTNARSARSYIAIYKDDKPIVLDTILPNEKIKQLINEDPEIKVCGDTKYLGIDGYQSNVFLEMLSLAKNNVDPLDLNPVYLKD